MSYYFYSGTHKAIFLICNSILWECILSPIHCIDFFIWNLFFDSARSRLSSTSKKGKKGKKKKSAKKKKDPPPPPAVGPWIQKLHLLNNGIDAHGPGSNLGPVMCMKMFRK